MHASVSLPRGLCGITGVLALMQLLAVSGLERERCLVRP